MAALELGHVMLADQDEYDVDDMAVTLSRKP